MNRGKVGLQKLPFIASKILENLFDDNVKSSAFGDFEDTYRSIIEEKGVLRARAWLYFQIIFALPAFLQSLIQRNFGLLRNYLKIAARIIRKQKMYSVINVAGLSISITLCTLIFLFVQNETNYDTIHENADRIYRVIYQRESGNSVSQIAGAPFPMAKKLQETYPGIEYAVQIYQAWSVTSVAYEDKVFPEQNIAMASREILTMFTLPFVKGDPKTALDKPNSVIITEEIAKKYFGEENPLGEMLNYNNQGLLEVTGVFEDISDFSHLKLDMVVSFEFLRKIWGEWAGFESDWAWAAAATYLLLSNEESREDVERQLPAFVNQNIPEVDRQGVSYHLEPMKDIYLHSTVAADNSQRITSNITYVYIFSTIALLALLIACINFTNLATARSMRRAKEVGMRKVMGARRGSIVGQFLGESLFLTCIAVTVSLFLTQFFLPVFNSLTEKNLSIDYFENFSVFIALVCIGLFAGFLSGSYPAFYLSGFRPLRTLKGKVHLKTKGISLRKILVVNQFAISTFLLICVVTIYSQLDFIRNTSLGLQTNFIIVNEIPYERPGQYDALTNEFLQGSGITGVTSAFGGLPGEKIIGGARFIPEGRSHDPGQFKRMQFMWVGYDFIELFGLEIAEGRPFSKEVPSDSAAGLIINESAAKELGWEGRAVGKNLNRIDFDDGSVRKQKVIGVVRDFNLRSLHNEIRPLVLEFAKIRFVVKTDMKDLKSTIAHLEQSWKKVVPEWAFKYSILDENVEAQYRKETRLSTIIQYFTGITIFIACLGLLGLAAFTIEQRTKEIGVRKVLGSSVSKITVLLSKEYTYLVLLSNVIAWPVAYYVMDRWLQNFAYRADIGYSIFIMAAVAMIVIAFATVSYQTIKAATANPIKSLRYE